MGKSSLYARFLCQILEFGLANGESVRKKRCGSGFVRWPSNVLEAWRRIRRLGIPCTIDHYFPYKTVSYVSECRTLYDQDMSCFGGYSSGRPLKHPFPRTSSSRHLDVELNVVEIWGWLNWRCLRDMGDMVYVGGLNTRITNPRWPPSWRNRKMATSRPRFERLRRNLARWRSSTLSTVRTVTNLKFKNSIWRRPPSWKIQIWGWLNSVNCKK